MLISVKTLSTGAGLIIAAFVLLHGPSSAEAKCWVEQGRRSNYWNKRLGKHLKRAKIHVKRKQWSSAKFELRRIQKYCGTCYKQDPNHRVCRPWIQKALGLEKAIKKSQTGALASRRCPKGKRPSRSMEKKLRKAYRIEFSHFAKKRRLKALRFDGTRTAWIKGRSHELLDFVICYKVKKRKAKPKCRFQYYTFKRYRRGRRWSKPTYYATTHGASGGAGDFFCRNMK